jgi:hypothetical protein
VKGRAEPNAGKKARNLRDDARLVKDETPAPPVRFGRFGRSGQPLIDMTRVRRISNGI